MATDNIELTRDAAKVLAVIYGLYKKNGIDQLNQYFWKNYEKLTEIGEEKIRQCLSELEDVKCIKLNVLGEISLERIGILYMENDFSRRFGKVKDVIELVKSFIPGF